MARGKAYEKPMTSTEQDEELRKAIVSRLQHAYYNRHTDGMAGIYSHAPSILENYTDEIMQFITADRKRVALEARLNEVQNAYEYWINGRKFISSYFRERIALLSNTKEGKDE